MPANNIYLFASTKQSDEHVSGWHAVHYVIDKLTLEQPNLIKATTNRHRVSTLFSTLDVSAQDRELFYRHMGHSSKMNVETYQAPPALQMITKVGPHLINFDSSRCEFLFYFIISFLPYVHTQVVFLKSICLYKFFVQ